MNHMLRQLLVPVVAGVSYCMPTAALAILAATPPPPPAATPVAAAAAAAAAPATPAVVSAPPALFRSGQIIFIMDIIDGLKRSGHETASDNNYCLGPKSKVIIISDDNRNGTNTVTLSIERQGTLPEGSTCTPAIEGYSMVVTESTIQATDYHTREIVMGILSVPFKFHLGDHNSTGGSSVGGYLGYRFGNLGGSFMPVIAGGLAILDTSPAQVGSSTSGTTPSTTSTSGDKTVTGFTVATGLISTLGASNAQAGLLVGWDYAGNNSGYKYEAKPWISLEIGYSFLGAPK